MIIGTTRDGTGLDWNKIPEFLSDVLFYSCILFTSPQPSSNQHAPSTPTKPQHPPLYLRWGYKIRTTFWNNLEVFFGLFILIMCSSLWQMNGRKGENPQKGTLSTWIQERRNVYLLGNVGLRYYHEWWTKPTGSSKWTWQSFLEDMAPFGFKPCHLVLPPSLTFPCATFSLDSFKCSN